MLYNPLDGEEGVKADSEKASIWIYHRFAICILYTEHSIQDTVQDTVQITEVLYSLS